MSRCQLISIVCLTIIFSACSSVPAISSNPAPKNATPVVIGQTYTIDSSIFSGTRRLTVKLPAQYLSNPEQSFPVLYLIDGGPEQDFPHLAGLLQSTDINYTVAPIILVGIETVNRAAEITPPASDPRYDEIFAERGGAEKFREFIREDVIPWVAANYRTTNDQTVMGESLAGLFIVDTLLSDPTLFTRYAAISPSLWWDNLKLVEASSKKLESFPDGQRELYLTMGNEGWNMQAGLDVLTTALESSAPAHLKWHYLDQRNLEHHGSIYHPAALDALRTFYTLPERTGSSPRSFYLFPEGQTPKISDRVKKNLELECNVENAVTTNLPETNADRDQWNGMCVLMKPGPTRTKGN